MQAESTLGPLVLLPLLSLWLELLSSQASVYDNGNNKITRVIIMSNIALILDNNSEEELIETALIICLAYFLSLKYTFTVFA